LSSVAAWSLVPEVVFFVQSVRVLLCLKRVLLEVNCLVTASDAGVVEVVPAEFVDRVQVGF